MPILDPFLHNILLKSYQIYSTNSNSSKLSSANLLSFFSKFLKIASDNIYQNLDTIESSKQFKKDLKESISFLNKSFDTRLTEQFFKFPSKNYYKGLYKAIKVGNFDSYGHYFVLSDKFQTKIFLFHKHSLFFYWVFLETPVAILCITHFHKNNDDEYKKMILEVDLLIGSGFTLVLCVEIEIDEKFDFDLIHSLYCTHKFTEIHLNFHFNKLFPSLAKNSYYLYDEYLQKILDDFDQINGYFYIYLPFTISSKSEKTMNELKRKPRFNFIYFSTVSFDDASNFFNDFKLSKPFEICENGFDYNKICIKLLNIPLYDSDNETIDVTPSEVSGICISYIDSKDFYYRRKARVKLLFIDSKNNRHLYKYANFDDIHLIRPDMCVSKTIYLTKTKNKTLKIINKIQEDSKELTLKNDVFKQKNIISILKSSKIQKTLAYVIYAYENFAKPLIHHDFNIHMNQIFTAYEACKQCIKYAKNPNKKGVVYQVETGEGKSCIVCLIAAVLALMKKTVHISSSNIKLSNRDYYESYHFFKKFELTSAVLLHYNELPYISFNNSQSDEYIYDKKYFPDKFFEEKLFKNSSNMNFSVCGIDSENNIISNKANIIFSTFVNFESLYLKMMEMCPAYITQYFKNCSLLIDEADSILIDELTNGTILSRSIKTNGNEILQFVYQSFLQKKNSKQVFSEVKNKWPECVDICLNDIESMYHEIELVQQTEFSNGKKYSIETVELNEKSESFFKKLLKNSENENNKPKRYKQIVPFDYDHKGILEPNKEFSGFIQQFIAIKEMLNSKENENMIIKNVSMNYLFVSHPIFVSLYNGVCGLTGTIGSKYDRKILKEQYKLSIKKVPRENPNYCVEFPILLCKDIDERNEKIVSEIIVLHEREYPVLAIFQELNEIKTVFNLILSHGIKNINVFDGKDEKIKPDKMSGIKGAVSLGTNVCGRGTDIKNPEKPLHVIVTYYTANLRVIQQAFGRTARQGNEGSVRIICLLDQFISPVKIINEKEMKNVLNDFLFKNSMQMKYIEKFKANREWIFSTDIKSQKLSSDDIEKLRDAKINVNRINAYNFIFPICMSIPTFLNIQAQKIFSLCNCPNSKYTWMLFQNYIREMILESWSLFIDKTEKQYYQSQLNISFQDYLKSESEKLFSLLSIYLPDYKNQQNYNIVPTFMHIFNLVIKQYESKIMNAFPEELKKFLKQTNRKSYTSFTFGFKPFSLLSESGSRINTVDGTNQDRNFIKDPELKYMQRMPNNCFSILSITKKIDDIFNWICLKINKVIGSHIGLKFFLRRTLGGCEFGVCYDFNLENIDENVLTDYICLIDKDPLFVFTISVKSMFPILAGILIIGLVYISSISKSISEWIMAFPAKITQKLVVSTLKEVASLILSSQIERVCNVICTFLIKQLNKQIEILGHYKPEIAKIFKLLMNISSQKDFSVSGDMMNQLFQGKTKLKIENCFFNSFISDKIPTGIFMKIGFILMLCFSSFMMNFHFHRKAINYDSKRVSAEYDKNQNTEEAVEKNMNVVDHGKINNIDFNLDIDEEAQ